MAQMGLNETPESACEHEYGSWSLPSARFYGERDMPELIRAVYARMRRRDIPDDAAVVEQHLAELGYRFEFCPACGMRLPWPATVTEALARLKAGA